MCGIGLIFSLYLCRERSSKSKAESKTASEEDRSVAQPPTPTTPEVVSVLPEEKRNEYKKLKLQLAIKKQLKEGNKKDSGSLVNTPAKQTQEKKKVPKELVQDLLHQQQQQQKLFQEQQQQQQRQPGNFHSQTLLRVCPFQ